MVCKECKQVKIYRPVDLANEDLVDVTFISEYSEYLQTTETNLYFYLSILEGHTYHANTSMKGHNHHIKAQSRTVTHFSQYTYSKFGFCISVRSAKAVESAMSSDSPPLSRNSSRIFSFRRFSQIKA